MDALRLFPTEDTHIGSTYRVGSYLDQNFVRFDIGCINLGYFHLARTLKHCCKHLVPPVCHASCPATYWAVMHQVPHLEISSNILLHIELVFFVPLLIWLNTMARVDHMTCCFLDIRVYSCANRCQYRRTQDRCIRYCGEGNRKVTHVRMNLRP